MLIPVPAFSFGAGLVLSGSTELAEVQSKGLVLSRRKPGTRRQTLPQRDWLAPDSACDPEH